MQAVFIRLENTIEDATFYRNSPNMQFYSFEGVQLIKMPAPYVQRTYTRAGIELENFVVTVRNSCGDSLGELPTDTIQIVRNFQDANGIPQVEWAINTDNQDFGQQLIYLDFLQGANDHIYSSPFYWTDYNSQFTSRWDYKAKGSEKMLSTQLRLWYFQPKELEEIEVYDPVGGGRATVGGKLIEYEAWRFSISDIYLFRLFKRMRRNAFVYCNFFKVTPFDAFDTPNLLGKENYAESDVNLVFDYENNYNPFYVPHVPPTPPPTPEIMSILLSVSLNGVQNVTYTTVETNFNPENLIYQYSSSPDGPWTTAIIAPNTDTRDTYIINPISNNWYYQVTDPVTGIVSNVVQLPLPVITITGVNSVAKSFRVYFTFENFTTNTNIPFDIQLSEFINGPWYNASVFSENLSPQPADALVSSQNITQPFNPAYVRIYYDTLNIYSQTFVL